jgi:uncharacterized protein (DUF697 family)
MSKKSLPKAIRPSQGGPEPYAKLSEPLPEGTTHAARRASMAPTDLTVDVGNDRKARARKLVEKFSLYSGVAGLLPVPFVDLAAIAGLQLQMLRRISQLYDIPFSKNRGKAVVASFAGTMIPASTGLGVASIVKSVPVAGTAIGALTTPAVAVGATYVIGMAFVEHFERGGTLLDFEPPDYHEYIKSDMSLRKTS